MESKTTTSVRLPRDVIATLGEIAEKQHLPMRTMLQAWIADKVESEVRRIVAEHECAFCHKTIPQGEEVYLDERSAVTFFCDNGVCAEAYICKCVGKVARDE